LLAKSTELAIDDPRPEFESFANQLRAKVWGVYWRQDWFVVDRFKRCADAPHLFADMDVHARLVAEGRSALAGGDADRVRNVLGEMERNRLSSTEADDLLTVSNIARG
jgi:molecular chaperone DnaK